jgi:hypothetical protein
MAWEYLTTKKFDVRYEIAANHLPEDKVILDLNCGEAGFRKFIKYKRYIGNDVITPLCAGDKKEKFWEFLFHEDRDIDVKSDIIVLFGYGGGEFTGEPLESKTAGESLIRLANKYNPEYIVIEMTQKWENDFKAMTNLSKKLDEYKGVFEIEMNLGGEHYHDKRLMKIFKLNG